MTFIGGKDLMKDYIAAIKGYRIFMLVIAVMNFLICAGILPSGLFSILLILAVIASCALSLYIKKNKKNLNPANHDRRSDMIVSMIWLVSLVVAMPS